VFHFLSQKSSQHDSIEEEREVDGETMKLVILETSDVHGSIYPLSYADNKPKDVGM
jgi:2',3'-cyclic-nucleotide 2'-phosphodiesterase (5'-nucleotidase family)